MSDLPKRRFGDRLNGPPTVIGAGVTMNGDLIAPGAVMVCGQVRGDGQIGGTLSIAKGAHWEGEVRTQAAVIAGSLTGNLTVRDKLELGAAAVIRGSVQAGTLAIARGAVIEGDTLVTSGAPITRFEEKRQTES
ncbi:MAG: polymer-forming cytoskeletal protein [Steroidobacteraceae bacterium]